MSDFDYLERVGVLQNIAPPIPENAIGLEEVLTQGALKHDEQSPETCNGDVICCYLNSSNISIGTIRYYGKLAGDPQNSDWIGIEWDDAGRGKNNGEVHGKQYFSCKEKHGSFIKLQEHVFRQRNVFPDHGHNNDHRTGTIEPIKCCMPPPQILKHLPFFILRGCSLLSVVADKYQYTLTDEDLLNWSVQATHHKTKPVEFTGRETMTSFFKELQNLVVLTLTNSNVGYVNSFTSVKYSNRDDEPVQTRIEILDACPHQSIRIPLRHNIVTVMYRNLRHLTELSLDSTLIKDWTTIQTCLKLFDKLRKLSLCNTQISLNLDYFSGVSSQPESQSRDYIYSFEQNPTVTTLKLDNCGLDWVGISKVVSVFENLEELHINNNNLTYVKNGINESLTKVNGSISNPFSKLKTLYINDNKLSSLHDLVTICQQLPNCRIIVAQNNHIGSEKPTVQEGREKDEYMNYGAGFDTLYSLSLESNAIHDPCYLTLISHIFQNLTFFKWQHNPVFLRSNHFAESISENTQKRKETPMREKTKMTGTLNQTQLLRALAIAFFPKLNILNGTNVSATERVDAERYYLSLYDHNRNNIRKLYKSEELKIRLEKEHGAIISLSKLDQTAQERMNREKEGAKLIEEKELTRKPLKRLLNFVIEFAEGHGTEYKIRSVEKKAMPSIRIDDLKSSIFKLVKIPIGNQKLYLVNNNLNVKIHLDKHFASLESYGFVDGCKIILEII